MVAIDRAVGDWPLARRMIRLLFVELVFIGFSLLNLVPVVVVVNLRASERTGQWTPAARSHSPVLPRVALLPSKILEQCVKARRQQ